FVLPSLYLCFFFTVPATTEIYTLPLLDALPISEPIGAASALDLESWLYFTPDGPRTIAFVRGSAGLAGGQLGGDFIFFPATSHQDRKSTRLNSSHVAISYAVFCLKKKKRK